MGSGTQETGVRAVVKGKTVENPWSQAIPTGGLPMPCRQRFEKQDFRILLMQAVIILIPGSVV